MLRCEYLQRFLASKSLKYSKTLIDQGVFEGFEQTVFIIDE